ncbi:LamB/YcsF family protein [Flavobacteria bacterium BBFL7]|nr:LamB/YcsF family protein [Flavobacteria bacterium BBFL7]
MVTIDVNMDLGEGMNIEQQVMPFISSCNVACGGHYGDYNSIRSTLLLAQKYDVHIGAHPSFEDKKNFGRVHLEWHELRFRQSVSRQIQLFQDVAAELGMVMHHIKMHGALYHATAHHPEFVNWTIQWIKDEYPTIPLYVPAGSLLEQEMNNNGLTTYQEAFADRRYHDSGQLVSRHDSNAVIQDILKLVNQLSIMVYEKKVTSVEEHAIPIHATTYCVHGDNLNIVHQFDQVIAALKLNGIQIG